MLSVHSLIPRECVLIRPPVRDKKELLRLLVAAMDSCGRVRNAGRLLEDTLAREALAPTGLGNRCAVPHAHSGEVENTVIAAALLGEGIDFGSPDGVPSRLILFMAGPERHAGLHLKLLSRIARLFHDPEFVDRLLRSEDPEAFLGLLRDREE